MEPTHLKPMRKPERLCKRSFFGHEVVIKRKVPTEVTPAGERPLREYSKEIGAAFTESAPLSICLAQEEQQPNQ